jgi:hypothetical protein
MGKKASKTAREWTKMNVLIVHEAIPMGENTPAANYAGV